MFEMKRRKLEPLLLPTQGVFNLPHHIGIAWEELAFDDTIRYTVATRTSPCPHLFCHPSSCWSLSCTKGYIFQNKRGGRPDSFSTLYNLQKTIHLILTDWYP